MMPLNVLIVDDHDVVCGILRDTLTDHHPDAVCMTAQNHNQAYSLLKENGSNVHVALVDNCLIRIGDGMEVISHLLRNYPDILPVMMSCAQKDWVFANELADKGVLFAGKNDGMSSFLESLPEQYRAFCLNRDIAG